MIIVLTYSGEYGITVLLRLYGSIVLVNYYNNYTGGRYMKKMRLCNGLAGMLQKLPYGGREHVQRR